MTKPQFRLTDLFLIVLFCAVAAGTYRAFWDPATPYDWDPNPQVLALVYLALLTTATAGTWLANRGLRRFCLGYAAFGWACLIFKLHWSLDGNSYASGSVWHNSISKDSLMAIAFGILCGLAAHLLLRPPAPPKPPKDPGDSSSK
jgi:hypothetical protein